MRDRRQGVRLRLVARLGREGAAPAGRALRARRVATSASTARTSSAWGSCRCSSRTASRPSRSGSTGEETFDLAPLEEGARTLKVTTSGGQGVRGARPDRHAERVALLPPRRHPALRPARPAAVRLTRLTLLIDQSINLPYGTAGDSAAEHSSEERREQLIGCRGHRVRRQRLPRHEHHRDREAGRHLAAVRLRAVSEQARAVSGGERRGGGPDTRRVRRGGPRAGDAPRSASTPWARPTSSCSRTARRSCSSTRRTPLPAIPALREPIRREFMALFDDVGRLSGARRRRSGTSWRTGCC